MEALERMKCEACRKGSPTVTGEEFAEFIRQVPKWEAVWDDGLRKLKRVFKFESFGEALAFTNKIGDLAEEEGHHPALLTEWGRVTVTWWTHKIKGLHRNDFIMAVKTERLDDPEPSRT